MAFSISFTPAARRDMKRLHGVWRRRIADAINALQDDPRPRGFKKLRGEVDLYRIRVGEYRVLYRVFDDRLIILVIRVGQRKDIYDRDR